MQEAQTIDNKVAASEENFILEIKRKNLLTFFTRQYVAYLACKCGVKSETPFKAERLASGGIDVIEEKTEVHYLNCPSCDQRYFMKRSSVF